MNTSKLTKCFLLCSILTSGIATAKDTTSCPFYTGNVTQKEGNSWNVIGGDLTYYHQDNYFTTFVVTAITYQVQNPNMIQAQFNNGQCTFNIAYYYDPIFKDGFEGHCGEDD
jgi:hypothetical protein